MVEVQVEYAQPAQRRHGWQVAFLVLAAIALAIVGKLCWDKFVPLIQARRAEMAAQEAALAHPWRGTTFLVEENGDADTSTKVLRGSGTNGPVPFTHRYAGEPIYYGSVGTRHVLLSVSRDAFSTVGSVMLVVRVFEPASFFHSISELRGVQVLPFFLFRTSYQIDAVTRSDSDKSILVLTGNRDRFPFRYELSVADNGAVWLAEDGSATATSIRPSP